MASVTKFPNVLSSDLSPTKDVLTVPMISLLNFKTSLCQGLSSIKTVSSEIMKLLLLPNSPNVVFINKYCSCGQVVRDFEREAKTRCNF